MADIDDVRELEALEDSEGWDDVEGDEDTEEADGLSIRCLFCDSGSISVQTFHKHLYSEHDFDLLGAKARHDLDFYGLIKFVNYIRSEVKAGQSRPDTTTPSLWANEKYLQPVLEDDALLFSLDDLDIVESSVDPVISGRDAQQPRQADHGDGPSSVLELETRLTRLQAQFDAYREQVTQTLDKRWHDNEPEAASAIRARSGKTTDDHYFEGYSYNDIHQTMLQDSVRTDAYRDFIYDNKHLFKDKIVMDVGCGTGILSMFCAMAGAKKVIAIDNSSIIDKARQIVIENGHSKTITFVKSRIEDIEELPDNLRHVDIIVSEWMGYCLLFEAMLPSVLVARDRFLKRSADGKHFDGLMIPSHCSLDIAAIADPEWIADNVSFWRDVYGFDMRCMLEKALDDVVIRSPPAMTVCGKTLDTHHMRLWDLYETKIEDLTFETSFSVTLSEDIDALDAWCIYFDMGFSPVKPAEASKIGSIQQIGKQSGGVTFSTGPMTKSTHWQSGMCMIDYRDEQPKSYSHKTTFDGTVKYSKGDDERALSIEIAWTEREKEDKHKQIWQLR